MEEASYPADESASRSSLQYRQHHAATFFRCAVMGSSDCDVQNDDDAILGYICSTRCDQFTHESMRTHQPRGRLLAIHSVVVHENYRRLGLATEMLQEYLRYIESKNEKSLEKIVLIAKQDLLTFYVKCGFAVRRQSPIVHGQEIWYELTYTLSRGLTYFVADAFADTSKLGSGNPAAVVILPPNEVEEADGRFSPEWMQAVAKEFNHSETAFVQQLSLDASDNIHHFRIRYFTPTTEVPLCGHATLASADILYQNNESVSDLADIVFHAPQDQLRVKGLGNHRISMEFPAKPAAEISVTSSDYKTLQAMIEKAFQLPDDAILFAGVSAIGDIIVELSWENFSSVPYNERVDYSALFGEVGGYTRGIILCCNNHGDDNNIEGERNGGSDEQSLKRREIDFCSRFFGPKAGVNEDPVTGSAHCVLGPYFCSKLGKEKVVGKQNSLRGGIVECEKVSGKEDNQRVRITGSVVTTMKGTLLM